MRTLDHHHPIPHAYHGLWGVMVGMAMGLLLLGWWSTTADHPPPVTSPAADTPK